MNLITQLLHPKQLVRQLAADSLYRNSFFLLVNMGLSSAAGFLFWMICTRLYSQTEVGYATALIAALGLATALSNLGLNRTIIRFFHNHESRAHYLATTVSLMLVSSTIVGVVMSLFLRKFGLTHPTLLAAVVFVCAVILSSLKNIFDNVFIALKSASATLIENTAFNIVKLALPFVFVGLGFIGIFSAQVVGIAIAVIVSFFILRHWHDLTASARFWRYTMSGKWHFAFGNYISDLVGGLPNNVLPLIIVAKIGPAAGALWYVATQIANVLFLICSSINQSLFAEASANEDKLGLYVRKTSKLMALIVLPLAALFILFAKPIMSIFGSEYTAGSSVLVLLSISSILVMINYIAGSILTVMKKINFLLVVNIINAAIVIGLALGFARTLNQIGLIWIVGEVANAMLFVSGAVWFSKRRGRA